MFRDHIQLGLQAKKPAPVLFDSGSAKNIEQKNILNQIYTPEKEGEAPNNDIGVYMSEKTSPEVRDFMKNVLFRKFNESAATLSAAEFEAIGKDAAQAIMDSMPDKNETFEHYESRVMAELEAQRKEYANKSFMNKLKKAVK